MPCSGESCGALASLWTLTGSAIPASPHRTCMFPGIQACHTPRSHQRLSEPITAIATAARRVPLPTLWVRRASARRDTLTRPDQVVPQPTDTRT